MVSVGRVAAERKREMLRARKMRIGRKHKEDGDILICLLPFCVWCNSLIGSNRGAREAD
jgi:hypothetical protein